MWDESTTQPKQAELDAPEVQTTCGGLVNDVEVLDVVRPKAELLEDGHSQAPHMVKTGTERCSCPESNKGNSDKSEMFIELRMAWGVASLDSTIAGPDLAPKTVPLFAILHAMLARVDAQAGARCRCSGRGR